MNAMVEVLFALLLGSLLVQVILAIGYVIALRRTSNSTLSRWPKVCILTALRGADPKIAAGMQRVIDLDYPDFEWRIVVDDSSDPAFAIVHDVLRNNPQAADKIRIDVLRERVANRSLLCSSFLQIIERLDHSVELITFWDGDMDVPPNWLQMMAAGLVDPAVGGTLGNRWYAPMRGDWGSLVRYVWNVGAVVPMWLFQIPWSGGLAMRVADFHRSELPSRWERGMVEDAPVKNALAELGLTMAFIPQLLIVNREDIPLKGAFRFIERQLLWTRLYHPRWGVVLLVALILLLFVTVPLAASVTAFAFGNIQLALVLGGLWISYILGQFVLLSLIESAARNVLQASGRDVAHWSLKRALQVCCAIPLAQAVYFLACVACWRARHVNWRGVRYEFSNGEKVRMVEYQPYVPLQPAAGSNVSL